MNLLKATIFAGATALVFTAPLADALAATAAPALYAGLQWRQLGPFRGGWATMVEGVPSKPNTFYFGAAGGGIWKTDDAGRTWQGLFEHGPAASIGALAVAPSNPNVIYIGTGQPEPRYDIGAGLGVFKSTDGGAHWTSLGLANTRYVGRIWVDPKNANIVLVGAQGHFFGPSPDRGIYRSTDGGKTWSHVLKINDWTGVVDIASDPKNPKIVFAAAWEARQYPWLSYFTPIVGTGSAIYKSADGGVTWHKLSGGGWPVGALGRIGLAVTHTAKGARVYASIDSKKSGGLYRSDDGGAHWLYVNAAKAVSNWYFSRLAAAPDTPDVVYMVGQSIRRCTQSGKTCEIIKGAPGGDDYHQIWINPLRPDHMITGSDQGAVVTVNGGATWSSWYNEPTGQFYHLAADNRFPYWIYSGQQDSGTVGIASRSDYGELTFRDWHPVGGDERDYDIPDPADPMIVYGSGLGGHISKWDGRTGQVADVTPWPESDYGKRPTLTKYHYMWMTPLIGSNTGPDSLYLGAQVLFRTQDQGKTWKIISGDLTGKTADAKNCDGDITPMEAKTCGYGVISAIMPSPRHADEIWAGTDDGLIQLTRDSGAHWSNITPPNVALWAKVASLDVSSVVDGVAYAAVDGHRTDDFQPHVLRTQDYGHTWQEVDNGLPRDHFVSVVRADPVKQGLLYAGTDEGVFVSFDNGDLWQPLQQNLPTAWVTDLLVHDNDLIAATEGRAIWVLNDVSPLREMTSGIAQEDAHLFKPADAWRVHADNNKDTPLPPETPAGTNPPAGAIIDYWLGANTKGPVVLDIRDGDGHLVRRFSSAEEPKAPDAERYFAKAWTEPAKAFEATPGMHRFVWNLRYERPKAIHYGYSIAAVWGHGTPISPEGPFVLPGDYTVVLEADGKQYTAPLHVSEDPRVAATPADLRASLDLSQKIDAALADASADYHQQAAVLKLLNVRFPKKAPDAKTQALVDRLREKPADGSPTFETAAGMLSGIEGALESADAAPTPVQLQIVSEALTKLDAAKRVWDAEKAGPLADLNAVLISDGEKPIALSDADKLRIEAPDDGQDLP
ncbi:MAG: exo-alpha-sialidase [Alphaproteobacteria bacterium]|nr:exo-alpha-sialidase [Alphaproteobacteria bacterium]